MFEWERERRQTPQRSRPPARFSLNLAGSDTWSCIVRPAARADPRMRPPGPDRARSPRQQRPRQGQRARPSARGQREGGRGKATTTGDAEPSCYPDSLPHGLGTLSLPVPDPRLPTPSPHPSRPLAPSKHPRPSLQAPPTPSQAAPIPLHRPESRCCPVLFHPQSVPAVPSPSPDNKGGSNLPLPIHLSRRRAREVRVGAGEGRRDGGTSGPHRRCA